MKNEPTKKCSQITNNFTKTIFIIDFNRNSKF